MLVVDPAQNNTFKAINRAWKQGATVQASAGASGAPIRYSLRGLSTTAQDDLVQSLALQAERTEAAPGRAVRQPRIGLYQPWSGSMDEGWTRWVLEQYGFAPIAVHPEDFKSPLAQKIDVLIIADDARVPVAGAAAGRGGRGGAAATVRPEYAYQLTAGRPAGLRAVRPRRRHRRLPEQRQHLRDPAVQAAGEERRRRTAARGILPARLDRRGHDRSDAPGDGGHAGEGRGVRRRQPGVRDRRTGFKGTVLARYQESGSPLLSGYLIGEKYLQGKAAALDVQLDAGHVVLLGFRPEWRGQPFGTFRVLFNAALFSR